MEATLLNVRYRGKDVAVLLTTATCDQDKVSYVCEMPNWKSFEIELTKNAAWAIVDKQLISARLVELIGDARVNSFWDKFGVFNR